MSGSIEPGGDEHPSEVDDILHGEIFSSPSVDGLRFAAQSDSDSAAVGVLDGAGLIKERARIPPRDVVRRRVSQDL